MAGRAKGKVPTPPLTRTTRKTSGPGNSKGKKKEDDPVVTDEESDTEFSENDENIPESWKNLSPDAKLYKVLLGTQSSKKKFEKIKKQVQEHDKALEMTYKELIAATIRIRNLEEAANEDPLETITKVENLFGKLGLQNLDYSDLRRIGRKEGKPRPIIVKFLRRKDKVAVLYSII